MKNLIRTPLDETIVRAEHISSVSKVYENVQSSHFTVHLLGVEEPFTFSVRFLVSDNAVFRKSATDSLKIARENFVLDWDRIVEPRFKK
jgi:hypothetical protein